MGSSQAFLIEGERNWLMGWARQQAQTSWELVEKSDAQAHVPFPPLDSDPAAGHPDRNPWDSGAQGCGTLVLPSGPGSPPDVEETEAGKRTRCIQAPSPDEPRSFPSPSLRETLLSLTLQAENLLPKERKEVGHSL